ncbi:MAG TPA: hypothetical protein DDW42_01765 [Desulfobacteraceae bacterium]|nr:hypothetical protein [Desulfobacteraceae bacterium]
MKKISIWIVFFLLLFSSSCGYRFTGGGNFPAGVKSVFISVYKNSTSETGIENRFTNDLVNEVTRRQKVALTGKDKADSIFSGVITTISIETISRKNTSSSSERRVTIAVDCKLTNSMGRLIWSRRGISDNEAYDVTSDKQVTEKNKREAISLLSERLAENIYNRITDDF